MFEIIKNFRNIPRNQVLKLKLISHLKHKKIMSEAEIKSLPREIFTKDLVEKYGEYLECRLDIPEVFEYFLKNNRIDYIPDNLDSNKQILIKCIENKRYDLIDDFSFNAFTEEVIDKLTKNEEYIKQLKKIPSVFRENSLFLKRCIELKKYELIDNFDEEAFTEEDVEKITQEEEYIKELKYVPSVFRKNSLFLKRCIELKKYELIKNFNDKAFTEENFKKIIQEEYIKELKEVPYGLRGNSLFLKRCIELKKYELIDNFDEEAFTEENVKKIMQEEEYIKELKSLPIGLLKNSLFLKRCIELKKYEFIKRFNKEAFTEENVKKIMQEEEYIKELNEVPYDLQGNRFFLQGCIELKKYELIKNFNEKAFTEENVKKIMQEEEYIKELNEVPYGLRGNSIFLKRCIELKKYELIKNFNKEAFTEENVKKIMQEEFIKKLKDVPTGLWENSVFLKRCIELKKYELIKNFNKEAFTEENVKKIMQEEFIKELKEVPYGLQRNSVFLKRCIELKKYELIDNFNKEAFTEENVKKIMQEEEYIKELNEVSYGLRGNSLFLKRCIELKKYELIKNFNKEAFTEENVKKIMQEEEYIKELKEVPSVFRDNSLFLQRCIECENYDVIKSFRKEIYYENVFKLLAKKLDCPYEEFKYKIDYLFNRNNEIFSTLDLRLLGKKYELLDIDFIEQIGNYEYVQNKILKLNDNQFAIFTKMTKILTNNNYDLSYIIILVLDNLLLYGNAQYDELIKSVKENELSYDQIKNLIYILKRENNIYEIISIDQLTDSNFKEIKEQYRKKIESSIISGLITNEQLKEAIFEEKFGLNITEVKFIIQRYCHNIDELEKSSINKEIRLILKSLKDVDDCNDLNELINYYNNTEFLLTDFYAPIFLESVIRNEYIKEYDKTLYRLDKKNGLIEVLHDNHKLNELEHIRNLINLDISGKTPDFYILDDDFNMLIHSLNAYTDSSKHGNFKEEWEIPLISNHGVCTSYIGNNQIATAQIKSIVLGFSSLEFGSIYRAANYDMGSINSELLISSTAPDKFLLPNKMIDNTRHTHNEIVIERRGTKSFKRMPDYLVLFVDDINNSANFNPLTNEHYKYTLQASIDFNIPIVIVDRLKYAKREYGKCEKLLIEFSNSFDNKKLDELLLIFFNNAIGCKCYDAVEYEYNKIFNQNAFDNLYNRIINIIEQQDDLKKLDLFSKLLSYLEIEKEKQGDEITISLEEKINLLKDNIEELKKYKMDKFIKINNLEDFERILLSMSVQSNDDDFMILYGNNTFKVDLSKASFKKVPELAEASFLNRMKLLETLSGKYIPICDLNDNVLFTEEEYNKMREKMSGLKQYNTGDFIFSDNLYFPQLDDYLDIIDDNLKTNNFINDAINNNVTSSLANINLIIGKDVELINIGSTARGTNLPNDIDFDYVMKIDLDKIDTIKQNLLNNLSCEEKTIMENRIRLKQVKIEGLNQLVDIDITFVAKENYYSSDTALAERLEQIKKQDYEKYKLILANVMYAKNILKEANVYKASRSDKTQAGLGGIGIENWILQNGGSLLNAAKEFLKYSKDTNFIDFEKKYFINDYGKNHVSMTRHQFPYDNYVMKNMREQGYIKMQKCLEQFMQSIENDISKKR